MTKPKSMKKTVKRKPARTARASRTQVRAAQTKANHPAVRRAKPKPTPAPPTALKPAEPESKPLPDEALDRLPRVALIATDQTLWLTRFDNHGIELATYPVTVSDAARAFRGFTGAGTGLLPDGILFWEKGEHNARIGLWLPPALHTIHWAVGPNEIHMTVPLPGLVFVGSGSSYSVFAALARPTSDKDALYHAPLSNVNESGLICFGNVKFPSCQAGTISAAAALFLESNFNEHLDAQRVVEDGGSLLAFLQRLGGQAEFPAGQLKLAHITVGQMVRGRMGSLDWDDDETETAFDVYDEEADNPAGRFYEGEMMDADLEDEEAEGLPV